MEQAWFAHRFHRRGSGHAPALGHGPLQARGLSQRQACRAAVIAGCQLQSARNEVGGRRKFPTSASFSSRVVACKTLKDVAGTALRHSCIWPWSTGLKKLRPLS